MRTSNLSTEALRVGEVGQTWEEQLTAAQGTLYLKPYQTFRVRAVGATTVTIDGILAMTMMANEIAIFNAGSGIPDATTSRIATSVTVVIGAANAYVQVARDNVRKN